MKIHQIKFSKPIDFTFNPNINLIYLSHKKEKSSSFSLLKDSGLNIQKENSNKFASKNISTEINQLIPQKKIIKLTKKPISLKKSGSIGNNILYSDAFINNFKPLLLINNEKKQKNRRQVNKSKEKMEKNKTKEIKTKPNSLFQQYRNYQKKFFSSANNFKINSLDINCLSADLKNKFNSTSYSSLNKTNVKIKSRNKKNVKNNFKLLKNPPRCISNIINRKDLDNIPLIINSPVTFIKNFKSNSEKERDEKNSLALLKLRNVLDKNWENRLEYVKEFFLINQIKDNEYYNNICLENFSHFIHDNIDKDTNMMKGIIETRIPMKEIIKKGIKFKNYSVKKLIKSNTMPIFNEKNKLRLKSNLLNKKVSSLLKNVSFLRKKTKKLSLSENINDKYQISEEGKNEKKALKDKIIKFRKFINKNYGVNIINKIMGRYNEEEKINYFNKRKIGTIYIPNKNNLVNSINKQTEFFKLRSTGYTSKIKSIHSFSDKDINDLHTELVQVKEDFINNIDKKSIDKENEKNYFIKTYMNLKKNIYKEQSENIIKGKKKLLEYIVYQTVRGRKAYINDILK